MSVRDFLEMFNDLCGVELHIYDFTKATNVFTSHWPDMLNPSAAVDDAGFADYAIESCDIYAGRDGSICMDINIATDEEEDEE